MILFSSLWKTTVLIFNWNNKYLGYYIKALRGKWDTENVKEKQ